MVVDDSFVQTVVAVVDCLFDQAAVVVDCKFVQTAAVDQLLVEMAVVDY